MKKRSTCSPPLLGEEGNSPAQASSDNSTPPFYDFFLPVGIGIIILLTNPTRKAVVYEGKHWAERRSSLPNTREVSMSLIKKHEMTEKKVAANRGVGRVTNRLVAGHKTPG